jgi:hypothetical protein
MKSELMTLRVEDKLYGVKLNILVGGVWTDFRAFVVRDNPDADKHMPANHEKLGCYASEGDYDYLWLASSEDLGVLVHEISHLVFDVLSSRGIKLNRSTSEAYAYYTEWWFTQIMDAMYKEYDPELLNN